MYQCVYHYFMIVLFTITKSILNAVQLDFSFNLVCVNKIGKIGTIIGKIIRIECIVQDLLLIL